VTTVTGVKAEVPNDVIEMLTSRFGPLTPIGVGAWSTAFRFQRDGDDWVVRVGEHVADFEVDAEMSSYASASLPIPIVTELDQLAPPHDHLFVCVSSFAPGQPLELVNPGDWIGLVPAVADLLQAMQAVLLPVGSDAPLWSQALQSVGSDDGRLGNWQAKLRARPLQQAGYDAAMTRIEELVARPEVAGVEPTLLHCDLINRNVHVDQGVISGVFDWGCRRWGDHLYDLAWFQFWGPWMPNLDARLLERELISRWGEAPHPDRLSACLLHIAADHLAYNAVNGDLAGGRELLRRLDDLDLL